jgi:phosphoribosylanthranilate isomerase
MKHPDNIRDVARLPIDMMGFVFYPPSLRYAGNLKPKDLASVPPNIERIGVFVNEPESSILEIMKKFDLHAAQLHGEESPEACSRLKKAGYVLIKAFGVGNIDDFHKTIPYENVCDYFLFDAKTPMYGGSGTGYDWTRLNRYLGTRPFFLSGGICADDGERVKELKHPLLYAVDLNSRFEIEPGLKNIDSLKYFLGKTI